MSIILCPKHERKWDSDKLDECPLCENELSEVISFRSDNARLLAEREQLIAALRLGRSAEDHLARQALLRKLGAV